MKSSQLKMSLIFMAALSATIALGEELSAVTNASEVASTNLVEMIGEAAPLSTDEAAKSTFEAWTLYIKQGGTTMIFLGLLSVLGLGCALERFVCLFFNPGRVVPNGFSAKVEQLWIEKDFDSLSAMCGKSRSILARVVETMLEHKSSTDFQEVKIFAEDKAGRELRLENRKAVMLTTVATLAPLLGLFGTVVGLLGAFQTVAAVGEMGDPSILADDIGKALITTVAGLAVAMPALFAFNLLKNRLNLYSVLLEEEVSDLINRLFIQNGKSANAK